MSGSRSIKSGLRNGSGWNNSPVIPWYIRFKGIICHMLKRISKSRIFEVSARLPEISDSSSKRSRFPVFFILFRSQEKSFRIIFTSIQSPFYNNWNKNHDKVLSCTFISSRLKIGVDHQRDLEMELKMELWGFVKTIILSSNPFAINRDLGS